MPEKLGDRYEIGELIGRGGMADVYLAKDLRLGRTVAIKLLRPDLARDPLFQSRFRREAQAVAALNHPSIVSVYDTGEQELGAGTDASVKVPYIVMEYVPGRTLRDLIKSGDISEKQAVTYTEGVLAALEYSHRAGIVHRDIKPANVIITSDGRVKVMDFGIARAIADSSSTMTQTQAVVGTAQYLSPEQARGETVDARSDLYSAGCLLYEMLTGRPPFIGDSPVSVAYQHVREEPQHPVKLNPEVPDALDKVVMHSLKKDKSERFQDAATFLKALRAAKRGMVDTSVAVSTDTGATQIVQTVTPLAPEAQTRAMAKVMTGGPLTTPDSDPENEDPTGDMPGAFKFTDTDQKDTKKKSRVGWIVAIVLLALALAGAGTFLALQFLTPKAPETVAVPNVAGKTSQEAMNLIYGANLRPNSVEEFHDSVPAGQAIGTEPASGQQVTLNSEVTVKISKGPGTITIPENLAGQSESEVSFQLRDMGLNVTTTRQNSAQVGAGLVIKTNPDAGQKVAAGSNVEIVVSTGKVTVPNFVGMKIEDAQKLCDDPATGLRCIVQEREYASEDVAEGTVTQQDPQPNEETSQGGTVTLTVAVKPEPTPTPTPTSTPKPTSSRR